jgi:hypothetical protein
MAKDSYPVYRRRDDGQVMEVRNSKLDNRFPYNPSLLMIFNCHINIGICSSINEVKYLYKYIYKGPDGASYSVDNSENGDTVIDDIKRYINARCVTPPEAAYMLYGFSLYQVYPSVLQLTVHLPGMNMVAHGPTEDLRDAINCERSQKSTLTEYFRMNIVDPFATTFLYREFTEHYRWDNPNKEWVRRKQRTQIGRMVYACPAEGERYYLRVLLNHVRGLLLSTTLKQQVILRTPSQTVFSKHVLVAAHVSITLLS